LALSGSMALLGVGVLGSLLPRSPLSAVPGPARAASLSLMPMTGSSSQSSIRSTELQNSPSSKPRAPNAALDPPTPRRFVVPQAKLPAYTPAVTRPTGVRTGSVFISTPGVNAHVFEAGRALGSTPRQLELSPGSHTLLLKSENGTRTVLVDVKAGSAAVLSLSLAGAPQDTLVPSAR